METSLQIYSMLSQVLMQLPLLFVALYLHLFIVIVACHTAFATSEVPVLAPIFRHPNSGLLSSGYPQHVSANPRPRNSFSSASTPIPVADRVASATTTLTGNEPNFKFTSTPEGGVNITVAAPSSVLASVDPPYSVFRLTSKGRVIKHCVPFDVAAAAAATDADSGLALRSALVAHLPLGDYCVQLGCSCARGRPCRRRPTRCKLFTHRAGIDMRAWRRAASVLVWRHADTASGPSVSVRVQQAGYRFESFNLSVVGWVASGPVQLVATADEWLRLDTNRPLPYNGTLRVQVFPDTWFCAGGTGGCRDIRVSVGPLLPRPGDDPPRLRAAAPSTWLAVSLAVLALVSVAAAGCCLVWSRRQRRRHIAALTAAAACVSPDRRRRAAQRPSVLLLHLARSDAELGTVRRLAEELRARGAAVTDCAAPDCRAPPFDGVAPLPVAQADCRVLLLATPAVCAALAAGGGGSRRERLLVAAVRHLAAGRLAADYGRLFQARLDAAATPVAGLVPGAIYTLPEHRHELVTALLTSSAAAGQPVATDADKDGALAEHSV